MVAQASGVDFDFLETVDWIARLGERARGDESGDADVQQSAAFLPIFELYSQRLALPGRDAFGLPMYDTTLALQVAPSLREDRLPLLGMDDVRQAVRYWRKTGLIRRPPQAKQGAELHGSGVNDGFGRAKL